MACQQRVEGVQSDSSTYRDRAVSIGSGDWGDGLELIKVIQGDQGAICCRGGGERVPRPNHSESVSLGYTLVKETVERHRV